jgi:S1-C subfamily serine protease
MRELCLAVALVLGLVALAWADFEEGFDAANRGDYATALKEWRPLAEQGHAGAQYNLGIMYQRGTGVAKDYTKAMKWYRRAAEQGDADAQYNLGIMYDTGQGVPQNYAKAARWYRRAAEQGHINAQYNLGYLYAEGEGVPQDYVQAHMWFNLAASQHSPGEDRADAAKNRDIVSKRMTPAELAEARRLARNWRPKIEVAKAIPSSPSAVPPQRRLETPSISKETVRSIQRGLATLGYNPGSADGVAGPRTRAAIRDFQKDQGIPVTGRASSELELVLRTLAAGQAKVAEHLPENTEAQKYATGSGFVVSAKGHVLTNDHVVKECREVRLPLNAMVRLVARDEENDLALLQDADSSRSSATFGQGRGARPGDDVVVAGYPLQGVLTSDLSITTGTVSALAGPGNDRRYLQITAPVQSGNSGGPLLDLAGNVVGVVVGKLDALMVAGLTGDIPQNVNFAISAWTVRSFLDAYNVPYETAPPEPRLTASEVAAKAQEYTVLVECWR